MTTSERESRREARESLREAIRVGECALANAKADIRALDTRLARCGEIIAEQTRLAQEYAERASSAPERIERIEMALARQRDELAALEDQPRERQKGPRSRLDELLARLGNGDMSVVGEIQEIMRKQQ